MRTVLLVLLIIVLAAVAFFLFRVNQFMTLFLDQAKVQKAQEQPAEIRECGETPADPWTVRESVTQWDLDVYRRRKEAWERCINRFRMDSSKNGEASANGNPSSQQPLQEYEEGAQ